MTVVYLDRVFLLNSVVDYLLFLCAARLCGFPLHRRRLIFCAVLGGVYAAAVFISELAFLAHPAIRLAFGGLLALAAFRRFRPVLTFFLLSAALAGTLLALGLAFGSVAGLAQRLYYADVSWQALILVSILFYVLLRLFAGQAARHGGGELLQIKVSVGGRIQTVTALHDTGNTEGSGYRVSGAGNGAPFRRRIMDTGGGRCFGRAAVSGRENGKAAPNRLSGTVYTAAFSRGGDGCRPAVGSL